MKTNCIKGNLELYERIEHLEKENDILREKNKDYKRFLEVLEQWFANEETEIEEENKNISIDLGTY